MNLSVYSILAIALIGTGTQFVSCKPDDVKKLEEAVDGLKVNDRENVVQFVNDVLKHDLKRGEIATIEFAPTFNAVTRASLNLLQQKHPELSKESPKKQFEELFVDSIVSSCENAIEQLYDPVEFYRKLVREKKEKTDQPPEQNVIDWMIRYTVCKALSKVQLSAVDVAHEVLRGKHSSRKHLLDPREVRREKEAAKEYKEYIKRVEMNKALSRWAGNRDKKMSLSVPMAIIFGSG